MTTLLLMTVLAASTSCRSEPEPSLDLYVLDDGGGVVVTVDFFAEPRPRTEVEWSITNQSGSLVDEGEDPASGPWLAHRVLVVRGLNTELTFKAKTYFTEKEITWKEE
jgi:hypothetical protein